MGWFRQNLTKIELSLIRPVFIEILFTPNIIGKK